MSPSTSPSSPATSASPWPSACGLGGTCAPGGPTSTWCTTTRPSAGESWLCSVRAGRFWRRSTTRSLWTAAWSWPHARTLREQIGKRRWYAFTKMQTRVAKRLPRVLTVSESSKRDIVGDHGVPPERIHVVPVGVDPEMFSPLPEIARVPGRLITTASADVTMKGLSFLLEAVAKLRTERYVELTIIGKAKSDSAASRTISELGLAGRGHLRFGGVGPAHRGAVRRGRAGRRALPV